MANRVICQKPLSSGRRYTMFLHAMVKVAGIFSNDTLTIVKVGMEGK